MATATQLLVEPYGPQYFVAVEPSYQSAAPLVPTSAITDEAGNAITDEAGNPITSL